MEDRAMPFALILMANLLFQEVEVRKPRYFVEINNSPQTERGIFGGVVATGNIGSADEIRALMIRRYAVPAERFTEKRTKADYILRINAQSANCRWTLLWNDRDKDEEMVIASKLVIYCANAVKDVVAAARSDWSQRMSP